jgi:hypothetical protein
MDNDRTIEHVLKAVDDTRAGTFKNQGRRREQQPRG